MSDARGRGTETGPFIVLGVLAAGQSRRLGRPKQLLPYRGRPLLHAVVTTACAAPVARVGVVLGAQAPEIATHLVGLDIDLLVNDEWQQGLATSVRCATWWALKHAADGLLLVTADQPRLDADHLRALVAAHRASGAAAASFYEGVRGVPALFPRSCFPQLLDLRGDKGAAALLRGPAEIAEVPWPAGAFDIDEPADVARLGEG